MAVKTLPFFNYTTRYRECPRTAAMGKSCGEPRAVELIEPLQTEQRFAIEHRATEIHNAVNGHDQTVARCVSEGMLAASRSAG